MSMRDFAQLLDALAFEPRRNGKIALMRNYFATTPDPQRGWALAALTRTVSFREVKPNLIRQLIAERVDPVLFELSYDFVGDLSETVSLMWPAPAANEKDVHDLDLTDIIATLTELTRASAPAQLARWLHAMGETERWALLKLITGGLRIGVSARLAKTALASLGTLNVDEIEEVWHGQEAPYEDVFAWAEGEADKPAVTDLAYFRPPMLAHPVEEEDRAKLNIEDFQIEWKWDGIRVQAARTPHSDGHERVRLTSRTGEDIGQGFPDLMEALPANCVLDGELLVVVEGVVQSFNALQQRLNRKTVTKALLRDNPVHLRAYDLLMHEGKDLRELPLSDRRSRLEKVISAHDHPRVSLSTVVETQSWQDLDAARSDPSLLHDGADATAIEGVMLKRRDSTYLAGRPKGPWWKWKRAPFTVDAVMLYAQRGHGKRSSFYSDYTFGVWRDGENGEELVPVGKAYSGFTDAELREIDRFVRNNTINRFGPVREVTHEPDQGLVLEVAFEGLARSTRHKSGVAMRFPRIARLRWDKPPSEADRIEALIKLLDAPKSES